MMRKIVWLVPVSMLAGLGSWWGASHQAWDGESEARKASQASAPQGELSARVEALEAAHDDVRRDIAQTRLATQNISQKIASAEAAENARDEATNGADPEATHTAEGTSLADRQQAGMEVLEQELQALVAAEAPDRAWAATAEEAFRRRLAGLEDGPVYESARCGSSLCSVVVSHEDDGAHVSLVNALQGNTGDFAGQVLVRRHQNPAGGYTTTFYLTKPGEHIPELQAALAGEY